MNNAIPTRIQGFLKNYPPFSLLEKEDLMRLSQKAIIQYLQPNEVIFEQGEQPNSYIYTVREGAVHLYRKEGDESQLIDICDEGDVFGIRPLVAKEAYTLTAMAYEETLLYKLKVDDLQPIIERHPRISWYFAQNFAAGVRNKYAPHKPGRIFLKRESILEENTDLIEVQSIHHSKKPIVCSANTTATQAAQIMSDNSVGSIIVVDENYHPIGILTDRDLRNKIVTGLFSLDTPVHLFMSSPVITLSPELTVANVQIAMMKYRIHHLCLTEDGTINSKVVGVISEHDLLVIQGNNPAIFIKELRRSKTAYELRQIREKAEILLKKYLLREVAISFICDMITEINDALITRTIELSITQMKEEGQGAPPVNWCWLALGSEGRGEQLLRTDQDNALVYEEVPAEQNDKVKAYFLDVATKATSILNQCGFDYCPGDMMASNPKWCMSIGEWRQQFNKWIHEPSSENVMFSNIFFDYRPIYGDASLSETLTTHIFELLDSRSIFLAYMAKNALQNPPPLTFFRNFVVEKGGEHKNEFDIKARAMMPLADAARLLILDAREPGINNTFKRFEHLASIEPQNEELYQQAADAYEILIRYRALQGLKNKDSGRYFNPTDLTKMERLNLRNSFQPISELQKILRIRFQLSLIS